VLLIESNHSGDIYTFETLWWSRTADLKGGDNLGKSSKPVCDLKKEKNRSRPSTSETSSLSTSAWQFAIRIKWIPGKSASSRTSTSEGCLPTNHAVNVKVFFKLDLDVEWNLGGQQRKERLKT